LQHTANLVSFAVCFACSTRQRKRYETLSPPRVKRFSLSSLAHAAALLLCSPAPPLCSPAPAATLLACIGRRSACSPTPPPLCKLSPPPLPLCSPVSRSSRSRLSLHRLRPAVSLPRRPAARLPGWPATRPAPVGPQLAPPRPALQRPLPIHCPGRPPPCSAPSCRSAPLLARRLSSNAPSRRSACIWPGILAAGRGQPAQLATTIGEMVDR
jgi:hypothetical protein